MKKSNAQAERHSNQAGALRGSRPWLNIYLQKHLAVQASSCVPHHLFTCIFFYFLIDYKHKHAGSCGAHALNLPPPPSFLNRLQAQAQAHPRPGFKHHAATDGSRRFLLTSRKILYIKNLERNNVKKRRFKNSS